MREYLKSPVALRDVTALLAKIKEPGHAVPLPRLHNCPQSRMLWTAAAVGQFIRITCSTRDERVHVYCREYDPRVLVTDLGDAIRNARLSTGRLLDPEINGIIFDEKGTQYRNLGFIDSDIYCEVDQLMITAVRRGLPNVSTVPIADLPIAILAVMLTQTMITEELAR